ncbi:MAG TPA: glycosyltransferase family 4 protein [Thermoleophilaceae bacterium]
MKVAIVSQPWARVLPPSESTAIWTNEVGRRLASRDEVLVLSRSGGPLDRDGVHYLPVPSEADWRELRVMDATARLRPRRRPAFSSGLYHRRYFHGSARLAVDAGSEVVHLLNFAQPARAVKRGRADTRVVLNMRCDWLSQISPRLVSRRARYTDLVLGCSDYVTERARPLLAGTRCETLHNGVDLHAFQPPDGARERVPDRLLFVGRVSPDKGLHVLLGALARVARAHPEATLDLVGDEALPPLDMQVLIDAEERVRALARFYGGDGYLAPLLAALPSEVRRRVRHTTWVGRDELPAIYRSSGMLVLPSVWEEPFGIPLVEAMASGLPVVATRVGGIPEVVEHGVTGLLVPPDDPDALAGAIGELLADPGRARELGQAGRRRAEERFSWDGVAARLRGLYAELF